MKELLEFLKDTEIKQYNDLLSSLELEKDILEDITKDLGNKYVPKLILEQKYEKVQETLEYIKRINKKISDIDEILENNFEEEIADEIEEIVTKDYEKYRVDENEKHTLYEVFKHKRPCAFMIENKKIGANSWKEVLSETCKYLSLKNKDILEKIVINEEIKGRKRSLFSVTNKQMFSPEKLKYINGYVETNLSADGIRNLIKKLLKKYNIPLTKYYVFFRADYTEMNEK